MAALFKDRVKQLSDTIGTGDINLTDSQTGFSTFSQQHSISDQFHYFVVDNENYEVGLGTLIAVNTIQRDTVFVKLEGGSQQTLPGTPLALASGAAQVATTISGKQSTDPVFNTVSTDTISQLTPGVGVTIDGVLLKDSQVFTDVINEKTAATGVTIDGVLLKDSQVSTDVINEKTSATGVTIDGALLKDAGAFVDRVDIGNGVADGVTRLQIFHFSGKTDQIDTISDILRFRLNRNSVGAARLRILDNETTLIDIDDTNISFEINILADIINEMTAAAGVTIDGVLLKDGEVTTGGGAKWSSGTGTPEGAVTGSVGDLFSRTDGGAITSFYVKESGTATNTGWVAK